MPLGLAGEKARIMGKATPRAATITSERISAMGFSPEFRPKASQAGVRFEPRPGRVRSRGGPAKGIPVVGNA
jgi:hypothetical protein